MTKASTCRKQVVREMSILSKGIYCDGHLDRWEKINV